MNEQANTRLVQQAYQRIHAGNMASFLTLLADDVQWKIPTMQNVPFAGTWRGRQQVGEFFRNVAAAQEQVEFAPEHFVAQDDKVVVLGHFVTRVKRPANSPAQSGRKSGPSKTASLRTCRSTSIPPPSAERTRDKRSITTTKLRVHTFSISLDGYGAGPNQDRDNPLVRALGGRDK
jgi:ketosteroid isomerase-like protein